MNNKSNRTHFTHIMKLVTTKNINNIDKLREAVQKDEHEINKICCGRTALHELANYYNPINSKAMFQILVESNADVNIQDSNGNTPLHIACEHGNIELVSLLIQANADINILNYDNYTPMNTVILYRKNIINDVIPMLLNANADPNIVNEYGTSLHCLCQFALDSVNIETLMIFLNNIHDINSIDKWGNSALIYAIKYYNTYDKIKLLIDAGADVNIINNDGINALNIAIEFSSNDIIRLLIEHHAITIPGTDYEHLDDDIKLFVEKSEINCIVRTKRAQK